MSTNKPYQEKQRAVREFVEEGARDLRNKSLTHLSRSTSLVVTRNQLFIDELEKLFQKYPIYPPKAYELPKKKNVKVSRVLNLMMSDMHYGADLNAMETRNVYSPVEEARRTAAVVQQAAEFKRQYRQETELYVHLLGDIIQGKLHDPESAAPLTEQYYRAVWNLIQAIAFLSTQFREVTVFATPGNHGRRKERHGLRAVNQKWDSIERMIYAALAFGLSRFRNVHFVMPLTPYYTYEAFGLKGFMTHGDTVLKPGFPGRTINVSEVRRQINELNQGDDHYSLFATGHVHVASSVRLPNKVVFLTNGCLLPSDEYAQSIGVLENACCQQLWESVPNHIYGDRRDAMVDKETDRDAKLDSIIVPFDGMNNVERKIPAILAPFLTKHLKKK